MVCFSQEYAAIPYCVAIISYLANQVLTENIVGKENNLSKKIRSKYQDVGMLRVYRAFTKKIHTSGFHNRLEDPPVSSASNLERGGSTVWIDLIDNSDPIAHAERSAPYYKVALARA